MVKVYSRTAISSEEKSIVRTVYTVKFSGIVYVLHAFQKKSKRGNATPAREIELIKQRLKTAEAHAEEKRV
jgi:phage-related protein